MGGLDFWQSASLIIVNLAYSIAMIVFVMRLLIQIFRVEFHNPVAQATFKATTPILRPLRRVLPPIRSLDTASVVVILLVTYLKGLLVSLIITKSVVSLLGLLIISIFSALGFIASLYIFFILVLVIVSWIAPDRYNPVVAIISQVSEPLLSKFRRMLPPLGGFDLSPMVASVAVLIVRLAIYHAAIYILYAMYAKDLLRMRIVAEYMLRPFFM